MHFFGQELMAKTIQDPYSYKTHVRVFNLFIQLLKIVYFTLPLHCL